jgi:hypothetical protein
MIVGSIPRTRRRPRSTGRPSCRTDLSRARQGREDRCRSRRRSKLLETKSISAARGVGRKWRLIRLQACPAFISCWFDPRRPAVPALIRASLFLTFARRRLIRHVSQYFLSRRLASGIGAEQSAHVMISRTRARQPSSSSYHAAFAQLLVQKIWVDLVDSNGFEHQAHRSSGISSRCVIALARTEARAGF